jgi:hypothetical protein
MEYLRRLEQKAQRTRFQNDPVAYAEKVLGVRWWEKQQEIARALIRYKRVFVKASHSIGKSHLAGGLVNWFFDSFDPSITLTTAPTQPQVVDVLWKEIRSQRPLSRRSVLQPKAPRMFDSDRHFAVGYTATSAEAFQGRHEENVLIVFDEAVGIDPIFWDAAEGMMTGVNCYWLAICNPTDVTSRAYQEAEQSGKWHVISVSALDHPNILAEQANLPPPFPSAIRLDWVHDRIQEWCTEVPLEDTPRLGDFRFNGVLWRPGALAESRLLGRWPSTGSDSVWSDQVWKSCMTAQAYSEEQKLIISCDVARFGDDFTCIMVRRGNCVLHAESHNGWDTAQTSRRLKELAQEYVTDEEDAKKIAIHIDDDGVGGGVIDQRAGYRFIGINAGSRAIESDNYPNTRSELWFNTVNRAREGRIDVTRLPVEIRKRLQSQLFAPTWKLDAQGRRVVEAKADTKKRLGRSPDDADAFNLLFGTGNTVEYKALRL